MPLNKKDIKQNVFYAFTAQITSLVLSVIMTLVIPKILGIKAFSYWQLFIFYTSYGGFLHFGLYDGLYLRLGGSKYSELNTTSLGWQLKISVIWQIFICIFIAFVASLTLSGNRLYVILCSCMCTLISNFIFFFGYILQAVNNIKQYSISLIIDKTLFIIFIVSSIFVGYHNFRLIIILYIICRSCALAYNSFYCKKIIKAVRIKMQTQWSELKENMKCGLTLTFSNISSMLILGIGRFLIDTNFGIIEFGKISFAIIMTNFFLVFMNQTSLVLFPALRRLDNKEQKIYFIKINRLLTAFTPIILLLYLPINLFIEFWLPSYTESLHYLIFLLPLCCYDGKMQMLNNTFLKVRREEKKLLQLNLTACAVCSLLTIVAVFAFHDITLVVLSMLVSLFLRSIFAEIYLSHKYNLKLTKDIIMLVSLVSAFILLNIFYQLSVATTIFASLYSLYLIQYKDCIALIKLIKIKHE